MYPTQIKVHVSSSSSPLKINKDSHAIKKPSHNIPTSSSFSSLITGGGPVNSSTTTICRQRRHPVIIYTHSPKIIHTHPKDFMALVQKLTGLSRSEKNDDDQFVPHPPKNEPENESKSALSDENESTSAVTEENNVSVGDDHMNACSNPSIFNPQIPPFTSSVSFPNENSSDLLCSALPFYNCSESMFFMNSMRNSYSSSSISEDF